MPKRAKVHECNASMVYDISNLVLAHKNAKHGKGHYGEVKRVDANPAKYLYMLQAMEKGGHYKTSPYKVFLKHDGMKDRELAKLPYFPDRIHHWAVIQVIEPFLIRNLVDCTYSAIPGRGTMAARDDVCKALKDDVRGTQWYLKIDIKKYYPSINREKLKATYERLFKDAELLAMINEIIDSAETIGHGWEDSGIPIGNYMSQYSGNLYLSRFDHYVKEVLHVKHYFRYMDDMLFFSDSKRKLQELRIKVTKFLKDVLDLVVKENWTLAHVDTQGVDFVGYVFRHNAVRLRKGIVKTLRAVARRVKRRCYSGKLMTKSMFCAIYSCVGWLKHCDGGGLFIRYVHPLNGFVVQYWRSIAKSKQSFEIYLRRCWYAIL